MLLKYVWFLFCISALYMLYSSNYSHLRDYARNYYFETVRLFYETAPEEIVKDDGEILFTASALKKYVDLNNGLYLAILGEVFDVSNGTKHYSPGQAYHAFTGRDGSAAFITGDFTDKGLIDDVSSLTNKQIQSLMTWVDFYRETYVYKGKLIGRYYDQNGNPTNEKHILHERVQLAKQTDLNEEQEKLKFPPCNIEWTADIGTKVWCTKNSGGIVRNWIGVPRMFYSKPGLKQHRCACINLDGNEYKETKAIIELFEGCDEDSTSCIIQLKD